LIKTKHPHASARALLFNAAAYLPQLIARWPGGQKDIIEAREYEAVLRQAKV
jgi:hypothetical protein